jgi:DNA polymerase-3 subunit alpha
MSRSNIKNLEEIINTNVFFIDLETTGLMTVSKTNNIPEEKYPDYKDLEKYKKCRMVSIGWLYMEKFEYYYEIELENINELLIIPESFIIPEKSTKIHGITNDFAMNNGKDLKSVLKKIGKKIKKCDYIIGYNVFFDINILLSELYNKKRFKTINKILKMKNDNKIICMGLISAKEAQPDNYKPFRKFQIPKQKDVYEKCYNSEPKNSHNAKSDVLTMIKIMQFIYNNK